MSHFISPLKGMPAYLWALFWWLVAAALTYFFWGSVFQYSPFMLFFAAVGITAVRSGAFVGMLVAVAGVSAVLLHSQVLNSRLWVPACSMFFNAGILIFLGSVVRRGVEQSIDAKAFQESIGEAVADFLWSTKPGGEIIYVNERLINYVGMSLEEMAHRGWEKYIHPDDLAELSSEFAKVSVSGQKFSWPVRYRKKDGQYRWFQCRAISIRDKAGNIIRWLGTSTDIHEQHLAEESRGEALRREKEARLEAESASRMKDEFLATISHELRTPLHAVFGWLHLLKDPASTPEEIAEGLEIIDRNAHSLGQLVNDLLDMSSMIRGKMRLENQSVDLAAVVKIALASAGPTAAGKGVVLEHSIRENIGPVLGDVARLQQVIGNLLSNAIKFTPKAGRVTVNLVREGNWVDLTVADSGEGIHPDFLKHVFERFRQADATATRRHGGLGLGLAIAEQLVDLQGGSITAESPGIGQGATFRVRLPLAAPAALA